MCILKYFKYSSGRRSKLSFNILLNLNFSHILFRLAANQFPCTKWTAHDCFELRNKRTSDKGEEENWKYQIISATCRKVMFDIRPDRNFYFYAPIKCQYKLVFSFMQYPLVNRVVVMIGARERKMYREHVNFMIKLKEKKPSEFNNNLFWVCVEWLTFHSLFVIWSTRWKSVNITESVWSLSLIHWCSMSIYCYLNLNWIRNGKFERFN